MTNRRLGPLAVSPIGFGAMVLSPGMYGPIDDQFAVSALIHAVDSGNGDAPMLIDTSDSYGTDFHNERLIGRALRGRRDEVVIATKFGFKPPPGVERHAFPVGYGSGELAVNAEPQHVRGYAERSLRRLAVDHIDLLYPHFPDPAVPIEDTVAAMADLVADGLVGHIGLSNVTADQLRAALTVHEVAAVQTEWSMWQPIDPALLALAQANGVGIVAWSPLGGGFLTGAVDELGSDDYRNNFPRLAGSNLQINNDRYGPVRSCATELGVSPGQLALAWLLHQFPNVVPIPGSRTPTHIDENLAAASIALQPDVLAHVDDVLAGFRPLGATMFGGVR